MGMTTDKEGYKAQNKKGKERERERVTFWTLSCASFNFIDPIYFLQISPKALSVVWYDTVNRKTEAFYFLSYLSICLKNTSLL